MHMDAEFRRGVLELKVQIVASCQMGAQNQSQLSARATSAESFLPPSLTLLMCQVINKYVFVMALWMLLEY